MTDVVHIALAANHQYLQGLNATLVSMICACSDKRRLRFHVFSDGLTANDKRQLEELVGRFGYEVPIDFREPDMQLIKDRFSTYYGTHTAYIRLFFPVTLPELDWVLWSDVDTLWFKDPIALWECRDSSASVVWVEDLPSSKRFVRDWHCKVDPLFDSHPYCCSGVMLMNLVRLREMNFIDKGLEIVAGNGTPPFADQGLFNALCWRDARIVDETWGLVRPNTHVEDGVVLHFNGLGSLFNDEEYSGWRPLYEIWFRYREQVIKDNPRCQVWSAWKRAVCWFIGCFHPLSWMVCLIPMRFWLRDNIQRTLFLLGCAGENCGEDFGLRECYSKRV